MKDDGLHIFEPFDEIVEFAAELGRRNVYRARYLSADEVVVCVHMSTLKRVKCKVAPTDL